MWDRRDRSSRGLAGEHLELGDTVTMNTTKLHNSASYSSAPSIAHLFELPIGYKLNNISKSCFTVVTESG